MKKPLQSPHGMKPQGVGPKIFRNSMPFLFAGIITGIFFPDIANFPLYHKSAFKIAGLFFILSGAAIYILSIIRFLKEFPKGKLITEGVYRLSRNPLYSSWILFIYPGLAFICNNWIFLLASVSMYLSLIVLIKLEEEQLLAVFGDDYKAYKAKVRRVVFIPKFH
jgi:protein-S-isoprenylcysteine O-methyltransferase Ste14